VGHFGRMKFGYDLYDADRMDESWITEWVEFGFREMAVYLRRQAAFEAYYQRRQVRPAA
jgi:hypothetical protein